jgi:hypothetical protein
MCDDAKAVAAAWFYQERRSLFSESAALLAEFISLVTIDNNYSTLF